MRKSCIRNSTRGYNLRVDMNFLICFITKTWLLKMTEPKSDQIYILFIQNNKIQHHRVYMVILTLIRHAPWFICNIGSHTTFKPHDTNENSYLNPTWDYVPCSSCIPLWMVYQKYTALIPTTGNRNNKILLKICPLYLRPACLQVIYKEIIKIVSL